MSDSGVCEGLPVQNVPGLVRLLVRASVRDEARAANRAVCLLLCETAFNLVLFIVHRDGDSVNHFVAAVLQPFIRLFPFFLIEADATVLTPAASFLRGFLFSVEERLDFLFSHSTTSFRFRYQQIPIR